MAFDFSRWSLTALFHYKSRIKGEPVRVHQVANPYHAVAVVPGARACNAAKQSARKRFLSAEAPLLPLKNCDAAACTCRYQHYEDRRGDPRRVVDGAVVRMNGTWQGVDRRRGGRRAEDA